MDYHFNIANIKVKISSELPIHWNTYIQKFICSSFENYDEYYECRWSNELSPAGVPIYSDNSQIIFMNGSYEERLHFFLGQRRPSMLYSEREDKKIIYIDTYYKKEFLEENNYCIFNALAFEKVLLKHDAIVLHSSFIIWKEQAILFTAPSGTGKSTQACLWETYQNVVIVNGDRTILRSEDGQIYAYGMPICGSSNICLNTKAPVRAIIYLEQNPENIVETMDLKNKIKKLISETTINSYNRDSFDRSLKILTDIAEKVDMYHFKCTKDSEAVDILAAKLEE